MASWLDALLGRIQSAGIDLTLGGALNFKAPHTAAFNGTSGVVDVGFDAAGVRGVGLTVDANGKLEWRPRPRALHLTDHFMSGNETSGSIGSLGWNLLGSGTPAYSRLSPTGLSGGNKGRLTTSASANDRTSLTLAMTESGGIANESSVLLLQTSWNFNNGLTNKRVFFGFNDDMSEEPSAAAACLGIYYDSAVSPNYRVIARNSSSGTPTDTGVAVPANTPELITMHRVSGEWRFYVGDTQIAAISSGLPTPTMNVGYRLETLETSAKNLNIGYFGMHAPMANSYDDDTFLEV